MQILLFVCCRLSSVQDSNQVFFSGQFNPQKHPRLGLRDRSAGQRRCCRNGPNGAIPLCYPGRRRCGDRHGVPAVVLEHPEFRSKRPRHPPAQGDASASVYFVGTTPQAEGAGSHQSRSGEQALRPARVCTREKLLHRADRKGMSNDHIVAWAPKCRDPVRRCAQTQKGRRIATHGIGRSRRARAIIGSTWPCKGHGFNLF
jgi:hypothetical protein